MQRLTSIQKVAESQIFQTGYQPILVFANDLKFYVCKYNTSNRSANMLFREWMNAHFLKIWEFNSPDFALLDLKPNHKPDSKPGILHTIPCFASCFDNESREVDEFIIGISANQKHKYFDKNEILKLSLYDIWTSNEDRSHNNYNLLLKFKDGYYNIVPIDGGNLFHTGNQDKERYSLSFDETLIASPLTRVLFSARDLSNKEQLTLLKKKYFRSIEKCKLHLYKIIEGTPPEW